MSVNKASAESRAPLVYEPRRAQVKDTSQPSGARTLIPGTNSAMRRQLRPLALA